MKENKFDQNSKERMMFVDLWNICQKYWIPEDSNEYWDGLLDEIETTVKKYDSKLLTKWLVAFIVQKESELNGESK